VDVPVASRVVRASPEEPYLSLRLDLDPQRIAELLPKVQPHGLPRPLEDRAICVCHADPDLIETASRLLGLMARPGEVELLAPLAVDEILIRLLRGPLGTRVAQIGQVDSRLQRVGKAVGWLREHYDQTAEVETLATMVHMSPSAFHQHFKAVTTMSPLQYQKTLRLQEARRLMLSTLADAGIAARRVGYSSASQFSREYARHFGTSPMKDIARLRERLPVNAFAAEED
jgi:AraC-like DNA-binding protein